MNRAPFLDHMLRVELPHVTEDLGDFRLSPKARRHISGSLKKADAVSVNVEMSAETAQKLDEVVAHHGLVRDALLSRLLIFLRGSDALLDYIEVPREAGESVKRMTFLPNLPASPMKAIEEVLADPLFYIRTNLKDAYGCGIYDVALPRKLDWAACKLEDESVPGTKAHKKNAQEIHAMFEEFDRAEKALFNSDKATQKRGKK